MKRIIPIVLIILLGLICYFNMLRAEFVWDDFMLIVSNNSIKSFNNIGSIFISELLSKSDYYRPLQALSYMIDFHFYGLNPLGFHLTNIILFIFNAILVYFLFKELTQNIFIALAGSILFVTAPFYTESVCYVSGRGDILLGIFILAALLAYIKERYYLCVFLFIISLLCKELAMIFPFAIIAYDFVFKKLSLKKVKFYVLLFFLEFLYMLFRLYIVHFERGFLLARKLYFYNEINLYQRLLTFLKSLVVYLKIIIFPVNLHMERVINTVNCILDWHVLVALFSIILSIYLLKKLKNYKQVILFGLFWFLLMLLPQSSFTLPLILAEHFLYLPAIGLFLILAIFLNYLRQNRRIFTVTVFSAWVIYYAFLTIAYNYNWRNMFTFCQWTLKYSPSSYRLHYFLGIKYAESGLVDLSIEEFRKGMSLDKNFQINNLYLNGLDKLYKDRGEIKLLAKYRHNLASMLSQKGSFDDALIQYRLAIEANPDFVESYNDLGCLYLQLGKINEAIETLNQALKVNPGFKKTYYNLGVAYAESRDDRKAIFFFKKALELDPNYKLASVAIKKIRQDQK